VTGRDLDRPTLIADVKLVIEWVALLADGAQRHFRYDGLGRDTYSRALTAPEIEGLKWPFATIATFSTWLDELSKAVQAKA
jgi:hypothetical protein